MALIYPSVSSKRLFESDRANVDTAVGSPFTEDRGGGVPVGDLPPQPFSLL